MFHCERCGIRFSTGALSGRKECPRCKVRDGVTVMLTWEPTAGAGSATRPEPRRRPQGAGVGAGP